MKHIGLDCHQKYEYATMIDTEAGEIKAKRLVHTSGEFEEFIDHRANTG